VYTLQPTLRLGRDVWDRVAMPVEEFRQRADRLRAAMSGAGLDALLLYGSGLNDCGHPTYVSNYIVKLPFSALVVLPRDGEPALIFEGATRGRAAAQATTWIEDVRPCWNIAETCLTVLEERNVTAGRIGLAAMPRLVPHPEWTTLTAGLARAKLVDAEDLVDALRTIKSTLEVAQLRRASRIVRRALAKLPPMPDELELAAQVIHRARSDGAEDIRLLVARPQQEHWALRPPEPALIRRGELISLMVSASWERYWSEATRTFVARADGLVGISDERLEARLHAIVSGAKPGVVAAEWVRSVGLAMTPGERHALEPYGFGHGIGITPEEPPALTPDSGVQLTSGMCLVFRTAVSSTAGLVLHGDTVVIE
jgi:Xaa-Pro aminopeptidase